MEGEWTETSPLGEIEKAINSLQKQCEHIRRTVFYSNVEASIGLSNTDRNLIEVFKTLCTSFIEKDEPRSTALGKLVKVRPSQLLKHSPDMALDP